MEYKFSFKKLEVWRAAKDLTIEIYKITGNFPDVERYGLVSQINRSAISVPSNIAEGRRRGSKREYRKFLLIAYSSGAELETQIEISKRLSIIKESNYQKVDTLLLEIMKMLNRLTSSLRR